MLKRSVPLALAAALLLPAAAGARGHSISGKLPRGGYTVIVLGYNGKAVSSRSSSFELVPPDKKVTLQLRDNKGKYAGPVVVGRAKGRPVLGVKAGAKLGTLRLRNGYATTRKPLPKKQIDAKRVAQARKGGPLGNGLNFGLVRSLRHGPSGPGGDSDLDGVPNAIDIDADGNLVLDPLQQGSGAHGAQAPPPPPPGGKAPSDAPPQFMSQIFLDLSDTLNADAATVTSDQIDAMLEKNLDVKLIPVPSGDLVEADCGGLSYCSSGGTGQEDTGGNGPQAVSNRSPFPACCDSDGNGLGNLRGPGAPALATGPGGEEWSLWPNAPASKIGSGDTVIVDRASGGVTTQEPVPISFVFNTVPAIARYDDGAGDSGTISYPAGPNGVGSISNPIPVAAGPTGDVVLTITFWRPQRGGVSGAGEPAFMDIGHLLYTLDMPPGAGPGVQQGPGSPACPASSVSTTDPNLSAQGEGAFADGSSDQPTDPTHTLSITLDLTRCIQAKGGSGLAVGDVARPELRAEAASSSDHANQKFTVRRVR